MVNDYEDLWDGSIDIPISRTQNGTLATDFLGNCCGFETSPTAWTGTLADGTGRPGEELGFPRSFNNVRYGAIGTGFPEGDDWIDARFIDARGDRALYALSEELEVTATGSVVPTVPEPGTFALFALGLLSLGLVRRRRRG